MIGVVSAVLFSVFSNSYNSHQQHIEKRNLITTLAIGINREYIEESIGKPYIKCDNSQTGFTDYIYKIDGALLRIIYYKDITKAIFLTIADSAYIGKYDNDEMTFLYKNESLGTFAFNDIREYENEGNYAQYTNGAGLSFYLEPYWTRPTGRYHYYILAIFPYGIFIPPDSIDNSKVDASHYSIEFEYMGNFYPNTYGIVDMEYLIDVSSMVTDTYAFDYLTMRTFDDAMDIYSLFKAIDNIDIDNIPDSNWFRDELIKHKGYYK